MAFGSVTLKPGIVAEYTPTLNVAGYSSSNLGRFRAGLFEKMGGWESYYPFTVGVPRAVHAWQDFNATRRLAVGSTGVFTTISSGVGQDITPQVLTTDSTPDFTTTSSSATITIKDPNIANVTTLDSIELLTPVSVGGIVLSGVYPIDLIVDVDEYRITAATAATASESNAGAVPVFDTTSGSSTVNVTLADHGLAAGDTFVAPISTSVGGITVLGTYTVVGVNSADVFTISVSSAATSTDTEAMNGGEAQIKYYIAIGPPSANGTGWGVNGWGDVPWGGSGTPPTSQTGDPLTTTDWTIDNWGQTLLATPGGGGLYQWTPGSGYQNLQLVPTAPIYATGMFISAPAQIAVMYGAAVQQSIGVSQDPLTYSWSDQLDFAFWTPNTQNPATGIQSQAGSNRIPTGSKIVAGMQSTQQTLLWTDIDLWSLNYVGPPFVFGQTKIGSNCGAVSKHGVAQMGGVVYWFGQNNFYRLAGSGPEVIPCSVWDVVFQNINTDHLDKCWVQTNTSFNEVTFWYPSSGQTQCNSYVKLNVLEAAWDYGTLDRSAGIDQSVLGNPILTTPTGTIYQHEEGYNADGQPLIPTFSTGYFYLSEGEDYVFVDQFLPDFKWGLFNGSETATVLITFSVRNFPGETPRTYGPYTMTSTTDKLSVRFRGRQVAITVTGSGLNNFFRLGKCLFRFAQDGRR
jgi:hypothetical protein